MTYPMDRIVDQTQFITAKLEAAKNDLGLIDVFYGDQDRIPHTPTACVEPGDKTRELAGVPRRALTTITTYIIVYHNEVTSVQTLRMETDALADDIEELIHADEFFQDENDTDQVDTSLVTRVESGFMQKKNSIYRSSRLTVEAQVKVTLPSAV